MTSIILPDPLLQPVDWATVDDAIFAWATVLLGPPPGVPFQGIWENQSAPQPAYPYLSFLRQGENDEGGIDEIRQQTIDVNGDVVTPGSGLTPDLNREIVYQPITFAVTIQAHVDFDSGAVDPGADARWLLSKLKRGLVQTSTIQLFKDAGLSVVRPEDIVDLSLVVNGDWISRAAMDVIFRTASVMTETTEFIEKVELESIPLGVTPPFVVDAS